LDRDEYERWMRQAEHTLESAKRDLAEGDYDWASFKAHQAAEYALKALLRGLGRLALGHSVSRLLSELNASEELISYGKKLDRHYLATRYPNQWVEGAPVDYYTRDTAEEAINMAERVIAWVRDCFLRLESEGRD